jgi:hypothetical protein
MCFNSALVGEATLVGKDAVSTTARQWQFIAIQYIALYDEFYESDVGSLNMRDLASWPSPQAPWPATGSGHPNMQQKVVLLNPDTPTTTPSDLVKFCM